MRVDFFFGPGSRYSYLASTQINKLEEATGATFVWRPLFSGDLIARAGGAPKSPQDGVYRRRDASRWARHYRVPYVEPEGAADWQMVAHACVAATRLGVGNLFAKTVLHLVYGTGTTPLLNHLLQIAPDCGIVPDLLSAEIQSSATVAAYERNLTDALSAGAFGVPTFVTEHGAMVWGQDRLPLLVDCLLFGDVAG